MGVRAVVSSSVKTVLIVDDHPIVPLALVSLIEHHFAPLRAMQAATLRQARALYQVEPSLVATVLDLRLPDATGLEALTELRALRPEVGIVVFSALDSEPLRRNAIALGAAAMISKTEAPTAILDALALTVGSDMPPEGRLGAGRIPVDLSPRQQQIWQGIAEGLSNAEIAVRHEISLNTTKAHVRVLLMRLGVRNRTEAATLYIRRPGIAND